MSSSLPKENSSGSDVSTLMIFSPKRTDRFWIEGSPSLVRLAREESMTFTGKVEIGVACFSGGLARDSRESGVKVL